MQSLMAIRVLLAGGRISVCVAARSAIKGNANTTHGPSGGASTTHFVVAAVAMTTSSKPN